MFAYFGQTVAVSDAGVLVGAPNNTDMLRKQGAAYFYPLPIDHSEMVSVPLNWAFFAEILFGLNRRWRWRDPPAKRNQKADEHHTGLLA